MRGIALHTSHKVILLSLMSTLLLDEEGVLLKVFDLR